MAKNGFSMSNRIAVETIRRDKTLTVNDCGKIFIVDTATAGESVEITMPNHGSAGQGWNCEFIIESGSDSAVAQQAFNITGSGDASDGITKTPFNVRLLSLNVGSDDPTAVGNYGSGSYLVAQCGKITHPAASQADGDRLRIINAKATSGSAGSVGDSWKWYVDGMTSGSVTLTHVAP